MTAPDYSPSTLPADLAALVRAELERRRGGEWAAWLTTLDDEALRAMHRRAWEAQVEAKGAAGVRARRQIAEEWARLADADRARAAAMTRDERDAVAAEAARETVRLDTRAVALVWLRIADDFRFGDWRDDRRMAAK